MSQHDARLPLRELEARDEFVARHIGPSDADIAAMLAAVDQESLDSLVDAAVPAAVRLREPLALRGPRTEAEALARLRAIAQKNKSFRSFIGQGYYGTHTPPVILRNVLENPAWYTAYTPYQPEISQ